MVGLGSTVGNTSPAAVITRGTPFLSDTTLPVRVPTINYAGSIQRTSNLGALAGRAGPVVGLAAGAVLTATSDDPLRTGIGNLGGIVGGAIGATVGVASSAPTAGTASPVLGIAGGLAGSFVGQQAAVTLVDGFRAGILPNPNGPPIILPWFGKPGP
jgi:hypothetical protein